VCNGRSGNVDHSARYEIRVRGRLSATTLALFSGLHGELRPVETVLVGDLRDQAELHGVLGALQDLGIELIEVRQLPEARS
jgi:hypothetical protein